MKRTGLLPALIGMIMPCCLHAAPPASDANMNAFVNDLMNRMTLEEKIGQLNLLSVGFDVTGPELSKDVDTKIRQGLVGGVFNIYTPGGGAEVAIAGRQ